MCYTVVEHFKLGNGEMAIDFEIKRKGFDSLIVCVQVTVDYEMKKTIDTIPRGKYRLRVTGAKAIQETVIVE